MRGVPPPGPAFPVLTSHSPKALETAHFAGRSREALNGGRASEQPVGRRGEIYNVPVLTFCIMKTRGLIKYSSSDTAVGGEKRKTNFWDKINIVCSSKESISISIYRYRHRHILLYSFKLRRLKPGKQNTRWVETFPVSKSFLSKLTRKEHGYRTMWVAQSCFFFILICPQLCSDPNYSERGQFLEEFMMHSELYWPRGLCSYTFTSF